LSLGTKTTQPQFIGYKQLLGLTLDNCAGGRTPWQTFISCEESREWGWGQCYQVDPEGLIPPEATEMTGNYGTPKYGNFEAAIFVS
jgi:secreted PhoX family phosphatase